MGITKKLTNREERCTRCHKKKFADDDREDNDHNNNDKMEKGGDEGDESEKIDDRICADEDRNNNNNDDDEDDEAFGILNGGGLDNNSNVSLFNDCEIWDLSDRVKAKAENTSRSSSPNRRRRRPRASGTDELEPFVAEMGVASVVDGRKRAKILPHIARLSVWGDAREPREEWDEEEEEEESDDSDDDDDLEDARAMELSPTQSVQDVVVTMPQAKDGFVAGAQFPREVRPEVLGSLNHSGGSVHRRIASEGRVVGREAPTESTTDSEKLDETADFFAQAEELKRLVVEAGRSLVGSRGRGRKEGAERVGREEGRRGWDANESSLAARFISEILRSSEGGEGNFYDDGDDEDDDGDDEDNVNENRAGTEKAVQFAGEERDKMDSCAERESDEGVERRISGSTRSYDNANDSSDEEFSSDPKLVSFLNCSQGFVSERAVTVESLETSCGDDGADDESASELEMNADDLDASLSFYGVERVEESESVDSIALGETNSMSVGERRTADDRLDRLVEEERDCVEAARFENGEEEREDQLLSLLRFDEGFIREKAVVVKENDVSISSDGKFDRNDASAENLKGRFGVNPSRSDIERLIWREKVDLGKKMIGRLKGDGNRLPMGGKDVAVILGEERDVLRSNSEGRRKGSSMPEDDRLRRLSRFGVEVMLEKAATVKSLDVSFGSGKHSDEIGKRFGNVESVESGRNGTFANEDVIRVFEERGRVGERRAKSLATKRSKTRQTKQDEETTKKMARFSEGRSFEELRDRSLALKKSRTRQKKLDVESTREIVSVSEGCSVGERRAKSASPKRSKTRQTKLDVESTREIVSVSEGCSVGERRGKSVAPKRSKTRQTNLDVESTREIVSVSEGCSVGERRAKSVAPKRSKTGQTNLDVESTREIVCVSEGCSIGERRAKSVAPKRSKTGQTNLDVESTREIVSVSEGCSVGERRAKSVAPTRSKTRQTIPDEETTREIARISEGLSFGKKEAENLTRHARSRSVLGSAFDLGEAEDFVVAEGVSTGGGSTPTVKSTERDRRRSTFEDEASLLAKEKIGVLVKRRKSRGGGGGGSGGTDRSSGEVRRRSRSVDSRELEQLAGSWAYALRDFINTNAQPRSWSSSVTEESETIMAKEISAEKWATLGGGSAGGGEDHLDDDDDGDDEYVDARDGEEDLTGTGTGTTTKTTSTTKTTTTTSSSTRPIKSEIVAHAEERTSDLKEELVSPPKTSVKKRIREMASRRASVTQGVGTTDSEEEPRPRVRRKPRKRRGSSDGMTASLPFPEPLIEMPRLESPPSTSSLPLTPPLTPMDSPELAHCHWEESSIQEPAVTLGPRRTSDEARIWARESSPYKTPHQVESGPIPYPAKINEKWSDEVPYLSSPPNKKPLDGGIRSNSIVPIDRSLGQSKEMSSEQWDRMVQSVEFEQYDTRPGQTLHWDQPLVQAKQSDLRPAPSQDRDQGLAKTQQGDQPPVQSQQRVQSKQSDKLSIQSKQSDKRSQQTIICTDFKRLSKQSQLSDRAVSSQQWDQPLIEIQISDPQLGQSKEKDEVLPAQSQQWDQPPVQLVHSTQSIKLSTQSKQSAQRQLQSQQSDQPLVQKKSSKLQPIQSKSSQQQDQTPPKSPAQSKPSVQLNPSKQSTSVAQPLLQSPSHPPRMHEEPPPERPGTKSEARPLPFVEGPKGYSNAAGDGYNGGALGRRRSKPKGVEDNGEKSVGLKMFEHYQRNQFVYNRVSLGLFVVSLWNWQTGGFGAKAEFLENLKSASVSAAAASTVADGILAAMREEGEVKK